MLPFFLLDESKCIFCTLTVTLHSHMNPQPSLLPSDAHLSTDLVAPWKFLGFFQSCVRNFTKMCDFILAIHIARYSGTSDLDIFSIVLRKFLLFY